MYLLLSIILALAGTAAIASIANLFMDRNVKTIPMEVQLPGNLPIIALHNNGNVLNFLLDSGSNISHICSEYHNLIESKILGTHEEGSVHGLGAESIGITMCTAKLKDELGNEYDVNLSISDHLKAVSDSIEQSTGVRIHGLLGTDFLKDNKYIIDFDSLEVYSMK